ncbi:cytochrome P450, partial [Gloeopeniophorella convolvens]
DALKTVFADRHTFQKDVEAYEVLEIYGKNLVGAEGSEWKRHKAVASPAFNESNNALVWAETLHTVHEWFEELDSDIERDANSKHDGVTLDAVPYMIKATLHIIAAAGFGRRMSWKEEAAQVSPYHSMSFSQAVSVTIHNLFVKVLTPDWLNSISLLIPIPWLSKRLKETEDSFAELRSYLLEIVAGARDAAFSWEDAENAALLRTLVQANMNQDSDVKRLTDEELLSDIFVFFLAGHETSAHTLSFALVLLALYPEAQQKIFDETRELWPERASTNAQSVSPLGLMDQEYTLATFRETLRLFPAETRLAKLVMQDTTVSPARFEAHNDGPNMHGDIQRSPVHLQEGSVIIADIYGVHTNPIHWGPDCKEFKPKRFIDTESYKWPRHAFLAFSVGARACIGSRFSLTESVCLLACLVRRYEILLPENVAQMDAHERYRLLTKWTVGVTLVPTNAMVRLRPRTE